ncbi:hypothetical protein [Nocardioides sp. MH1]|uniref:hypothetical protein n=1 Tax=Nocardioides sp. MH1 TaxID=3242490 RepID=UPI003521ADBC
MADEQTEWLTTWGGRIMGIIGLAFVALVALAGITGWGGDYHPAAYAVCALVAVGLWLTMLRPAVGLRPDVLLLRNPLSTISVPLAAIEQVAVGQFLALLVGGRRLTSTAVGRGRFAARRDDQLGETSSQRSFGGLVEVRLQHRAADARSAQGIELRSEEQEALAAAVRREPAWLEIGALVASVVAVVVTFLV